MNATELRERYEKSTQGEWKAQHHNSFECVFDKNGNVVCFPYDYADAKFIAVSHNSMPKLLDTVDALQKRLDTASSKLERIRALCGEKHGYAEGYIQLLMLRILDGGGI